MHNGSKMNEDKRARRSMAACVVIGALLMTAACNRHPVEGGSSGREAATTGSSQCRACHPAFYKKWATSHHGLAMQPFTAKFAASALWNRHRRPSPLTGLRTGTCSTERAGFIEESGPKGVRRLPIQHAMGGKNTYYFLTPMDRGRLQVLPLAYDVQKKSWYDMAASGVRMHAGGPADRPLPWTDPAFTFNTSCYSCHVSQLRTNYDLKSDTYHSTWREPGINCETCHGDGEAHVALYKKDLSAKAQGHANPPDNAVHRPAAERDVRSVSRQDEPGQPRVPGDPAVLRSLRPGDPGRCRLLSGRPRSR